MCIAYILLIINVYKKRDTNIKSASLEITISMFQQTIQNDLVDGHMQDIF